MSKKIVAVCACPMGLAHTFMAADSLKKAADDTPKGTPKFPIGGGSGSFPGRPSSRA